MLRADERFSELETLLAFFATFVLDSELVQQIMRWDMTVLRESPWYQEILNTGLQQGLEQGLEQGLQRAVIEAYETKFGPLPEENRQGIIQVQDTSRLDQLLKTVILAHSTDEFEQELGH